MEDGAKEGEIKVTADFEPKIKESTQPTPAQWAGYKTLVALKKILGKADGN